MEVVDRGEVRELYNLGVNCEGNRRVVDFLFIFIFNHITPRGAALWQGRVISLVKWING